MIEDPEYHKVGHPDSLDDVEPSPDAGSNHRVPCVIALDTSGSMSGRSIDQLNEAVRNFKADLINDPRAAESVELAVVTFDSDVTVERDFRVAESFDPPTLTAGGRTHMGEAIFTAADLIEDRKDHYKAQGLTYNRPWLWVMTDGKPNGGQVEAAKAKIQESEQNKRFLFFGAGTDSADFDVLEDIAHDPTRIIKMKGEPFDKLFQFVSGSLKRSSQSGPNKQLPLPKPSSTWAEVST